METFRKHSFLIFLSATSLFVTTNSSAAPRPMTVDYVDLERYQGQWFEIASKPQPFQRGCICTTARYDKLESGNINVLNRCFRNGEWSQVQGTATVVDERSQAELSVQFGAGKPGEYLVIGLDEDYRYAVVASPSEEGLWILSKTVDLRPDLLAEAIEVAATKVNLAGLRFTEQSGCPR